MARKLHTNGVLSDPSGTYFGHTLIPAVECDFISLTREVIASTRSFVKFHKSGSSWNYARNNTKWEGHDLYLGPPPLPPTHTHTHNTTVDPNLGTLV